MTSNVRCIIRVNFHNLASVSVHIFFINPTLCYGSCVHTCQALVPCTVKIHKSAFYLHHIPLLGALGPLNKALC